MINMRNVSFSYRDGNQKRNILTNISTDFQTGKVYTIYGSSGAGKTTCLSLLGGLDTPSEGVITIDGRNIKDIGYGELRKSHAAFVF